MLRLIDTAQAIMKVQNTIKKHKSNGQTDIVAIYNDLYTWSFKYCIQQNMNNLEAVIPVLSLLLNIWSCWILESKTICHYRQAGHVTKYRSIRDAFFLNLKESIIEARNIALKEKRDKKAQGDQGKNNDIPLNIKIPDDYDVSSIFSIDRPRY